MKNLIRKKLDIISVFLLFILSRLPSLGYDIFNTDVWKWKARSYDFSSGIFYLDFAKTLQKYHPGVTLMWLNTIAIKVYNIYYETLFNMSPPDNDLATIFGLHFTQKLLIVIVTSLVVTSIYYVLKNIFDKKYALVAVAFLATEPLYIALSRVVHLEGLMSTFMLASFVWLFWYLQDSTNKKRLYISALLTGLACLTKTVALFMLPFAGLILFYNNYTNSKKFLNSVTSALKTFLPWLGLVIITFVVLWPAFFAIPGTVLSTLYRGIFTIGIERDHGQIFFGKFVEDPGVFFYPLVFLFKASPFLIPGLVGYYLVLRKSADKKVKTFVLYSIFFSFFYLLMLTIPSKKLMRYLLPSIISLVLVSSFFYIYLIEKYYKKFKVLFLSITLVWLSYLVWIHPDYLSYHSPYFGGLRIGIQVLEPKWIIGQHALIERLNELKQEQNLLDFSKGEALNDTKNLEEHLVVAFPEKYYTQVWPLVRSIGGWAVIEDLTGESKFATYFIYPVWDDYSATEKRYKLEFKEAVKLRGVPVFNIYERHGL